MNYLSHVTLKVFMYLLYSKNSILLINFKDIDRHTLVEDLYSYEIQNLFVFKDSQETLENLTLEDMEGHLYGISANIETLEIILPGSNKQKLLKFIKRYINAFKGNNLISLETNYYPFRKSYDLSMELLEEYKEFGKKILIKILLKGRSKHDFYTSEVRFLDILFYFNLHRYIDIEVNKVEKVLYEVADNYLSLIHI